MLRGVTKNSLVELVEIREHGDSYRLVEFYINPAHIVSVEDHEPNDQLFESMSKIGLSDRARFSTVIIREVSSSRELQVVGSARSIYLKISNKKGLLKG